MTLRRVKRLLVPVVILMIASTPSAFAGDDHVLPVSPWMISPFVLLLLSIAILPFVNKHWWEKYYPIVTFVLSAITAAYYFFIIANPGRMLQTGREYFSFIILITSLFVVAGGIHIRLKGKSRPLANVLLLAVGAVLSNLLGTTGASMILIRPYLRVNRYRLRGFHVVFFIFVVSNI